MLPRQDLIAESARLRGYFEAAGATPVEAAILQPAETLLDLYGEDIRARAYVTADPLRGELMLRPDFTVPVVLDHMAGGADPARYTYSGEVFRKQENDPGRPNEYFQVGFEIFARDNPEAADAEVFALVAGALQGLPLRPATGDVGILTAAIDALNLSPDRRGALMRHLWRPRRFRALIERFAGRRPDSAQRHALLARVRGGEDVLAMAGPAIGLRAPAEVRSRVDRLVADARQPVLSAGEVDLLDQVTGLKDSAPAALERLHDISVDMPAMSEAVARLSRRLDALAARGVAVEDLPFEASFGRTTLEYYDGFVFGFTAPARPDLPPVATGGRYDALTRVLGKGRSIPAVGAAIRPEVVLRLRQGAAS